MQLTYNMTDLADDLAQTYGLRRADSAELLQTVFKLIKAELTAGRQVRIHQFGTFRARTLPAGTARSPINQETLKVPERKSVKFVPSPALKTIL